MIRQPVRLLHALGTVLVIVAWAALAHLGSSSRGEGWSVLPGMLPLLVAVLLMFWRSSHPVRSVLILLPLATVVAWNWAMLARNLALLYFFQHFGINLALSVFFGRTLFFVPPLITRLAALVNDGELSVRQIRYTRQATIVWTLFFLCNALISTGLFIFAPAVVWSLFANLLAMPLLGAMFVIEYVWRAIVLPPEERPSVAQVIQVSRRFWATNSSPGSP